MGNRFVILLTATIVPSRKLGLVVSDPEDRLEQYCRSIEYWNNLQRYRMPCVFFDNSGFGKQRILSRLEHCNLPRPDDILVYSMEMNEIPPSLHYGYAELGILDYCLRKCPIFQNSQYFIKATGRLTFPKIEKLLSKLPRSFLFAVDTRENCLFVKYPQFSVTTQLMLFQTNFYRENLLSIRKKMNPSVHLIENLFYRELLQYRSHADAIHRWPVSVPGHGFAAHMEKNYSSPKHQLISLMRSCVRSLVPHWWV